MHILIATGGSDHSQTAVGVAAQMAQHLAANVTILVVTRRTQEQMTAQQLSLAVQSRIAAAAPTVVVKALVRVGAPADEIVAEAEDGRYDLILLGEKDEHGLLTRLVGPVSEKVAEQVLAPVLIARRQSYPFRNLLFCDSGVPERSILSRLETQLCEVLASADAVTVLHVMSQISAGPGVSGQQLRADADSLIEDQSPEGRFLAGEIQRLRALQIVAEPKVRHGLVVDEILTETAGCDYDLVIIGAREPGGWQHFLLDNLARRIIQGSNCSVLIVH